jgi:hypothetical protein
MENNFPSAKKCQGPGRRISRASQGNGPLGRDGFIKRHWIKDLKKLFKSGFPNIIYIWHLYDYINIIYIIITYYNNNLYIYITILYLWYKHLSWSVVNWYIGRIPVALDRCAVGCESFCARCWPRSVPRTSWSHGPTRAGLVDQRNRNHMDVSEIVVPPKWLRKYCDDNSVHLGVHYF